MKSLQEHLRKELANEGFRKGYEREVLLAKLAVQIAKRREGRGLTQAQLAKLARITQQQISKVEHAGAAGFNVNTLIRLCDALDLEISLRQRRAPVSTGRMGARKSRHSRAKPRAQA